MRRRLPCRLRRRLSFAPSMSCLVVALTLKSCAGSGKASGVRGGRSEGRLSKSGNVDRNRRERERKGTMAEAQNGYGREKGKGKEGAEAEKEEKAEVRKERIKKADAVCWRGWIDGNDGQTNFWGLTKFGRVVREWREAGVGASCRRVPGSSFWLVGSSLTLASSRQLLGRGGEGGWRFGRFGT